MFSAFEPNESRSLVEPTSLSFLFIKSANFKGVVGFFLFLRTEWKIHLFFPLLCYYLSCEPSVFSVLDLYFFISKLLILNKWIL